ncbi:glycosyltransferase family 2 protein [Bacillota bacterium Lsc_1132]
MNPKVSIIIPFYNCAYVDQAIQSALAQTYQNIEVILVDDGSTVFTEKIRPFLGKINYLKKENGGTATALNHGIDEATGEYIAWLSSDDLFFPEKIFRQMEFMLKNHAEISFTNYHIIDQNNEIVIPFCGRRLGHMVNDIYQDFLKFNVVNGCTVMMKKDVFEKVGYFNHKLKYTQDYEMWFRLLINGHKMHYLDEALTKFRQHKESGTSKYQPQMRQEMRVIEKIYRPKLIEYMNVQNKSIKIEYEN